MQSICDDGSSAWSAAGHPNTDCAIDGCTVDEPLCWPERLDYCYDSGGSDNGTCVLHDSECKSNLSCYGLYLTCVGEWSCKDSHWWGCGEGTCTEDGPEASDAPEPMPG